jgi:hypothetical protein
MTLLKLVLIRVNASRGNDSSAFCLRALRLLTHPYMIHLANLSAQLNYTLCLIDQSLSFTVRISLLACSTCVRLLIVSRCTSMRPSRVDSAPSGSVVIEIMTNHFALTFQTNLSTASLITAAILLNGNNCSSIAQVVLTQTTRRHYPYIGMALLFLLRSLWNQY